MFDQEIEKALLEAKVREDSFFKRHGVDNSHGHEGQANEAHRAWVRAVEREYKLMGTEVRVHLDTPLARKAFILGYWAKLAESEKPRKPLEMCGNNSAGIPTGCGESFAYNGEVFRCVDCQTPFHRHCLKAHCADDLQNLKERLAESERVRSDDEDGILLLGKRLALAERERDELRMMTGQHPPGTAITWGHTGPCSPGCTCTFATAFRNVQPSPGVEK